MIIFSVYCPFDSYFEDDTTPDRAYPLHSVEFGTFKIADAAGWASEIGICKIEKVLPNIANLRMQLNVGSVFIGVVL
jgi:hypothetical protein